MEEILKQATAKLEKLQAQYFELLMDADYDSAEYTAEEICNYLKTCRYTIREMNDFKKATQDSK